MTIKSYYSVLGLPRDATDFQIRAAHTKLLERIDVIGLRSADRQTIDEAYAVLSDPLRRRQYDAQLPPEALSAGFLASLTQPALLMDASRQAQPGVEVLTTSDGADHRRDGSAGWQSGRPPHQQLRRQETTGRRLALSGIVALVVVAGTAGVLLMANSRKPPESSRALAGREAAPKAALPTESAAIVGPNSAPVEATAPPATAAAPSEPPDGGLVQASTAPPPGAMAVDSGAAASESALSAGTAVVTAARAAPVVAQPARPAAAAWTAQADSSIQAELTPPPGEDATTTETGEAAPQGIDPTAAAPSETVVIVPSSPFGGRARASSLTGRYCRDTTGGEVYVPFGAPVPVGLACSA